MITSRLKHWLSDKYVPPVGIYLENCSQRAVATDVSSNIWNITSSDGISGAL
jgi:hypothetical protein